MLRAILVTTLLLPLPAQAETRCGWYHHPTPGWHYLEDADGQWWFSSNAARPAIGYDAVPGFEDAYTPTFDARVRIDYGGRVTEGSYGFSCACAEGDFGDDEVLLLSRLRELPLARCEQDQNLPDLQLYGQ